MRGIVIAIGCLAVACGPGARSNEGLPCGEGQTQCDGNELLTCVNGHFQNSMSCPNSCVPTLGCTLCVPGTGTCNGETSTACNTDGMGFTTVDCDPVQGETCDTTMGVCTGACAPGTLGQSYIGCEYYPTVTGNTVGDTFDFAIAIANTSAQDAMVTIEDGALPTSQVVSVPASSVVVQKLPWQTALKLCPTPDTDGCELGEGTLTPGGQVAKGAYHVRATNPITVYQFNSLEYQIPSGTFSYSNDASLLLPTNVWRLGYFAAAWQPLLAASPVYPSEMAVTAWQDNTMVTINSKAATTAAGGAPGFTANSPQTVMLNAGDVLELASQSGDFTGSQVMSSAPVQLISGHFCADIPDGACCCDHIEESMFGVETLGENYIINAPAVTTLPAGKVETIRIVATQASTTLTYNPPQPGAPASIANVGDFVEIDGNAASFEIQASAKVLVAQYMEGEDEGGGTGDPAMALAVPVEQYRSAYSFQAPTSYESNYVDVTAPMGASVTLDGMQLTFTPIGTTGYGISRVTALSAGPNSDGNHTISGDQPFGITVYGYGQYTSYWYPGGLNLTTVID
ncbi:MAG TPA: IgGFc-binding protein [Kofleriaceae bacterium]|jgi:hypothetical protein